MYIMWSHKCMVGNAYIMRYADSVSGFATNVMCEPGSKGSPCTPYHSYHVDGSVQERRDPSALAMELTHRYRVGVGPQIFLMVRFMTLWGIFICWFWPRKACLTNVRTPWQIIHLWLIFSHNVFYFIHIHLYIDNNVCCQFCVLYRKCRYTCIQNNQCREGF